MSVQPRVLLFAVLAGLVGAAGGWAIAHARAPSNEELQAAARSLAPPLVDVRDEQLTDRPASFANPPWDLPGSRVATLTFATPPGARHEDVIAAFTEHARATGWRAIDGTEVDERNRLYRFRRARVEAAIELERGEASAIRVRPATRRLHAGVVGFIAGASLGLAVGVVRRRRAGGC